MDVAFNSCANRAPNNLSFFARPNGMKGLQEGCAREGKYGMEGVGCRVPPAMINALNYDEDLCLTLSQCGR